MYHISRYYLGKKITLTAKIPENLWRDDDGFVTEDSITPRICVAPTFRGCLLGMAGESDLRETSATYSDVFVYKTKEIPTLPLCVPDAENTGEMWLLKDSEFTFVTTLRVDAEGKIRRKPLPAEEIIRYTRHMDYYNGVITAEEYCGINLSALY